MSPQRVVLVEGSPGPGLTWQITQHGHCWQCGQEKSLIYGQGCQVFPAPFHPPLPLPYLCPLVHTISFHFIRRWHGAQQKAKASLAGDGIMSFFPIMVHPRKYSLPLLVSSIGTWLGFGWPPLTPCLTLSSSHLTSSL